MTQPNVSYGDKRVASAGEILCKHSDLAPITLHGQATGEPVLVIGRSTPEYIDQRKGSRWRR